MGRHGKKIEHPVLVEIVTSLPMAHTPTTARPPEDLAPEAFREISTGENTNGVVTSFRHTLLGLLFWAQWIAWTIYMWFFQDAPFTDLFIAFAVWLVVFVVTIIGVPIMRRKARNRVRL